MLLTIHRGTHEIGGSCVEITSQDSRIVIDIGMPLIKEGGGKFDFKEYKHLSGRELVQARVLPDIKGFYEWDTSNKPIDGLLVSHAHMDHYGFLPYISQNLHCYLGEGTKRLIDITSLFLGFKTAINKHIFMKSGEPLWVGAFKVTPYLVDHAAFDAYAFLVESDSKKILYTGDFREHGRKAKAFQWFLLNAPKDIDVLLLEGTMMGNRDETFKTEKDVEEDFVHTIKNTPGIVLALLSGQNIDRIVSLYRATIRTGRTFVVDVYTANVLADLHDLAKIPYPSKEFDRIRVLFPYRLSKKIATMGRKDLLYRFKTSKITKNEIMEKPDTMVMLVRSSMIPDLASMKNIDGATVIYSMWHSYLNESSMKPFLDFMQKKNMQLVPVHTSGHAYIKTLQKVVKTLQPKTIIPIHTFSPDLYKTIFPNVIHASDREEIQI
jgi:ribonuclease J